MQAQYNEDQNTDTIDILKYLVLLWHWAWLIVIIVLITAGGAYFGSKLIHPTYQAQTTILVDIAPTNNSIDYNTVLMNSQLTQTYSQMLTKTPMLDLVATRLNLSKVDPKSIIAKPVANTQLISIFAESTNPKLAADVANTLVAVFSDHLQSLQKTRYSEAEQSLQTQIVEVENNIKAANDQLSITTDTVERDRLQTSIANYNQTYASLVQSYDQIRLTEAQTSSDIIQIEPATIPIAPVRPKILLNVAAAVLISLVLAVGIVVGADLLNDTVKTPEEIKNKLGLPVLGVISHYHNNNEGAVTEHQPLSPIAEAYRILRTNLKYAIAGTNKPLKTLLVTSALPREGKTDVLVNLGIVLAQNRMRVLLIDADLRRPALHRRLGLDNLIGLCQIFVHPELGIDYSFQPTSVTGLSVITSGDTPPNPSELLSSQCMESILEELKSNYDIILIDTPPILPVTDAAAMLPFVDGVLMVVKPGSTNLATLRRVVEQFYQDDSKLLGVVLNDINLRNSSYGYYYKHYKYDTDHRYPENSKRRMDKISAPKKIYYRITRKKDLLE
jgi:capsular exopolysaccharide synthesis family protein